MEWRETEMQNWNQCDNLLSDVFLFRLQAIFRLLCNELATHYCNNKLDIDQQVSVGESMNMHHC